LIAYRRCSAEPGTTQTTDTISDPHIFRICPKHRCNIAPYASATISPRRVHWGGTSSVVIVGRAERGFRALGGGTNLLYTPSLFK
jgi:hypothetical protein